MSSALRISIQLRKETQNALGVFAYCRMIHQYETDRKNTDLSPAYQSWHVQQRRISLSKQSPGKISS